MDIGVVGLGLIGGSMAKTIRRSTPHTVLGTDADPQVMYKARLLEAIDGDLTDERLAICDMVLPADKRVPLILDDALVTFDDERLHAALDYLLEESQRRQILLFTCQKREMDYLQGKENVTVTKL